MLRFGAYSEEVIERLNWMRDVLGPTLKQALKAMEGGLAVNPLIAKAIAMGDEFHQRNIAASLAFLKEVGPIITSLDIDREKAAQVIKFLSDTDQFFLNIMMASAKAVMDSADVYKRQMLHGFGPASAGIVRCAFLNGAESHAKSDAQMSESNVQTRANSQSRAGIPGPHRDGPNPQSPAFLLL